MAGKKKIIDASEAINTGASEAEARAMLQMNEWIEQYDNADRMSIGQWYGMPDEYASGWVFTRCGQRGAHRAEALAAQLKRMGYQTAPAGTKKAGFEAADGDAGLYLCVPHKAYLMIQDRKRKIRNRVHRSAAETFQDEMARIPGGSGTVTESEITVRS